MTIQVKVINKGGQPLPSYETAHSAGLDLRAALSEAVVLAPGERGLIPTGLFLEIPPGYEAQVRPRSGLALKRGLTLLNAPGTIDADYRGEVGVIMVNLSAEEQPIGPGERIAQLIFAPVTRSEWIEVETLDETERGLKLFTERRGGSRTAPTHGLEIAVIKKAAGFQTRRPFPLYPLRLTNSRPPIWPAKSEPRFAAPPWPAAQPRPLRHPPRRQSRS